MESQEMIITVQTDDVASVFGQFDGNVKKIEKEFEIGRASCRERV